MLMASSLLEPLACVYKLLLSRTAFNIHGIDCIMLVEVIGDQRRELDCWVLFSRQGAETPAARILELRPPGYPESGTVPGLLAALITNNDCYLCIHSLYYVISISIQKRG